MNVKTAGTGTANKVAGRDPPRPLFRRLSEVKGLANVGSATSVPSLVSTNQRVETDEVMLVMALQSIVAFSPDGSCSTARPS